jgi:hypothetical protein
MHLSPVIPFLKVLNYCTCPSPYPPTTPVSSFSIPSLPHPIPPPPDPAPPPPPPHHTAVVAKPNQATHLWAPLLPPTPGSGWLGSIATVRSGILNSPTIYPVPTYITKYSERKISEALFYPYLHSAQGGPVSWGVWGGGGG